MSKSVITQFCDDCGEVKDQLFVDLRYARPLDLDKLDKELAAISVEKIGIEEMNFDDVEDYEEVQNEVHD